jgi:biotin carboxyl carrier protein
MEVIVNGNKYDVELDASTTPLAAASVSKVTPQDTSNSRQKLAISPSSATDASALRAPMPGLILDVCVKPGDKVIRGQHMMSLEAMKMKNSIRSPRDATIASVAVVDQQKVAYNDLLVTFE